MKAVIMAGGKGTRLASVTNNEIPKSMVQVCAKPILEHQIETLKANGISDYIIVGGFLLDVIKCYFKDGIKWNVNISYIEEKLPLGTAGSFFFLKEFIKDDFLMVYGDIIFDFDLSRMLCMHKEKKSDITLLAHPNSHPFDSDLLQLEGDKVTGYIAKNKKRYGYNKNMVNSGIYIINYHILEYAQKLEKIDFEKDILFNYCLKNKKVFAYSTPEYVKDIGTPERLKSAEKDIRLGVVKSKNLKNRQKCIFLDRDGTLNRYVGLLSNIDDMQLETGVAKAVKHINHSGYLAIVITNQPVIARNLCSIDELEQINNKLDMLLGEEGAYVDDIKYCPHHPDKGYEGENCLYKISCNCRKPGVGLIEECLVKYNIEIEESWIIGDTTVDIQTGKNIGLHTALLLTGVAGRDEKYQLKAEIESNNLENAVKAILQKQEEVNNIGNE